MKNPMQFIWNDIFRGKLSKEDSIIQTLRKNMLFCTLSERELRDLAKMVYVRNYDRDESVFSEGARGFGMFMIAKGKVAIQAGGETERVEVATLEEGSFFGEMTLIQPDGVRSASARTTESSVLIGFFKPDLTEILERRPAMGAKILMQLARVLSERLIATTERMAYHEHKKSA